jgi:hypothetical protein
MHILWRGGFGNCESREMTTLLRRGDDPVTIPARGVVTLYPSVLQRVMSSVTAVTTPMGDFLFLSAMG